VGKTLLFFGCRKSTEDFVYKSEWEVSTDNRRLCSRWTCALTSL
jgi:sulfite reductase alpha subunit-like flavoprotein